MSLMISRNFMFNSWQKREAAPLVNNTRRQTNTSTHRGFLTNFVLHLSIAIKPQALITQSSNTINHVSQPKNPQRKPHPQHLAAVYRANFGLQNTAIVALARATCSIDREHERYGEPLAHDGCSGRGYARSWRICGWHVSHTPSLRNGNTRL